MPDIKNLNIDSILYKLEVAELYKQLLKTSLFSKEQKETPAAQQVANEIRIFIAHRLQALLGTNESQQAVSQTNISMDTTVNSPQISPKKNSSQPEQDNISPEYTSAVPVTINTSTKQKRSARKTKKAAPARYAQIKTAPGQIPQPTTEQLATYYSLSLTNNNADTADETTQLRNLLLRDELARGSIKIKSDITEE